MESNNDGKDEHFEGDDGIMEFDGLTTMQHLGGLDTLNEDLALNTYPHARSIQNNP
jgi:hypothetical protein